MGKITGSLPLHAYPTPHFRSVVNYDFGNVPFDDSIVDIPVPGLPAMGRPVLVSCDNWPASVIVVSSVAPQDSVLRLELLCTKHPFVTVGLRTLVVVVY